LIGKWVNYLLILNKFLRNSSTYKFWDGLADRYDGFVAKYAQKTYSRSIELMALELNYDLNVLEIGTGTGLIAFALANKVGSIKGIDYSPQMIKVANGKLAETSFSNIEFKLNPATKIDYSDNSFDLIVASNVFHLFPYPDKVMKEVDRLLADGGKVIMPTYCHGQNFKTRLLSFLTSLSGFKVENRWSVIQFSTFVKEQGFEIIKQEVIKDRFPMSYIVAVKKELIWIETKQDI
jgi:ubiquinone/menaquinone biosynthesis C-methylase UbiE